MAALYTGHNSIDHNPINMSRRLAFNDPHLEKRRFMGRLWVAIGAIVLLTLLLVTRLFYLQVVQQGLYTTLSQQNQLSLIPIAPNRGLIYDRNGVLLAENVPVFSLDIIPDHTKHLDKTLVGLQKIIVISPEDLQEFRLQLKRHRPFEPIPLKYGLTEKEVARFSVNQYRFPGVVVNARLLRHYPLGEAMANVVGYVGRINQQDLRQIDVDNYSASNYIGKVGTEKEYEKLLHGTTGYQQVEIDASGRTVRTLKKIAPTAGENIFLTIDSGLQIAAEKALGKERGSVVAIDPNNGEVLALVSHPSYDPNLFVKGISANAFHALQTSPDKPLFNRAIRGQFPLASTIKPFIALGGLSAGVIKPDTTIYDPGLFRYANHTYKDWIYKYNHSGHGEVDVSKAIIVSCDTFFYRLSLEMGVTQIDDILSQFGFGKATGLDMGGERAGLLPTPAWKRRVEGLPWYTGDTIISGIGQGSMLATPLQLANGIAIIAEHGVRYQPHLLLKMVNTDKSIEKPDPIEAPPVTLENPDDWNVVIKAMEGVVRSINPWGTARLRFGPNPPYSVAAKTGTAQLIRARGEAARDERMIPKRLRDHSLFIAFAPIHHPKIAIGVVVENSESAPTVARKILDYYLGYARDTKLPQPTRTNPADSRNYVG